MEIPAGDPSVTHEVEVHTGVSLAALAPWFGSELALVHIVALHMHQLGKQGSMAIHSPVGDTCLLEIPAWDFRQQMAFHLQRPVELYLPEDLLFLSCTFDNSAENQPIVDGVRHDPVDRNWGPGTDDEMCIGYVYLTPVLSR
jgi:hypothetical protein